MFRQRNIPVLAPFSLYNMQHLTVKIQMLKFDIPHFHAAQSTAVYQTDEQFMFQEFGTLKHTPDLFPTQDYRKFLHFSNGGKVQKTIRQTLSFQQEPKTVYSMLKIRLRRGSAPPLQFKKIIFDLFRIQFGGQSSKVKRQGRHMTGIIIKGSGAPAQDRNIPFEALQQFSKTTNFARGAVQNFVYP